MVAYAKVWHYIFYLTMCVLFFNRHALARRSMIMYTKQPSKIAVAELLGVLGTLRCFTAMYLSMLEIFRVFAFTLLKGLGKPATRSYELPLFLRGFALRVACPHRTAINIH